MTLKFEPYPVLQQTEAQKNALEQNQWNQLNETLMTMAQMAQRQRQMNVQNKISTSQEDRAKRQFDEQRQALSDYAPQASLGDTESGYQKPIPQSGMGNFNQGEAPISASGPAGFSTPSISPLIDQSKQFDFKSVRKPMIGEYKQPVDYQNIIDTSKNPYMRNLAASQRESQVDIPYKQAQTKFLNERANQQSIGGGLTDLDSIVADKVKRGEMSLEEGFKLKNQAGKQSLGEQLDARQKAKLDKEKPKAVGALDNTLREYDNMIREAEDIKNDPSLSSATGMTSLLTKIPGTGAKRVGARLETLKAKTLLNVLSSLKQLSTTGASGFGNLTNIEGENIRNSISTLDNSLGTKDFKDSIDRFVSEMKDRKVNMQKTFDDTYGNQSTSNNLTNFDHSSIPRGQKYQAPDGTWRIKQ